MPLATLTPSLARSGSHSLLGQIGNTPLLRLAHVDADLPGVEIYAKAEFFNPGGSVKARAALNMIQEGERTGKLTPDKSILDDPSGNTGIADAMLGASRGYRVGCGLPGIAAEHAHAPRPASAHASILPDQP